MKINDGMIKSYLADGDCMKFSEEWYFTSSQLARESSENIFSIPMLGHHEKENIIYTFSRF